MAYREATARLAAYRREIAAIRARMREIQNSVQPEPVQDYELKDSAGTIRLSGLFRDKEDLVIVHNMGTSCAYCTLFADGYNGIYEHLADRLAFVVSSPDSPLVQQQFARSRGWRFPMVSHAGTTFATDLGYGTREGHWVPGLSVFRRDGQRIVRVSDAESRPWDDFCALWHIFDLLPGGFAGWKPRPSYSTD